MLSVARHVQRTNASACSDLVVILRLKDDCCYCKMLISIYDMINGCLFGRVVFYVAF
jgi:hypothetical protein